MRTSLTLLAVNSSSNGKILRALPALDSYVRLTMIDYTILVELKKERKEDFELCSEGKRAGDEEGWRARAEERLWGG